MKNCKIDLFGVPYEIKTEIETQRIKDLKGRIYFDDQEIIINNKFPEETQKATLLHEIMHKILEHVGLERDFLLNNKIDLENATELITSSLFNVMMSNKQLFMGIFFDKYLIEKFSESGEASNKNGDLKTSMEKQKIKGPG